MNRVYVGLKEIAKRLGVGRNLAREWCERKFIRSYRLGEGRTAPWCCIESEIDEDVKSLPEKFCQ